MSLSNKVTGSDGANPLTMLKLHKTSELPRAHFRLNIAQGLSALKQGNKCVIAQNG